MRPLNSLTTTNNTASECCPFGPRPVIQIVHFGKNWLTTSKTMPPEIETETEASKARFSLELSRTSFGSQARGFQLQLPFLFVFVILVLVRILTLIPIPIAVFWVLSVIREFPFAFGIANGFAFAVCISIGLRGPILRPTQIKTRFRLGAKLVASACEHIQFAGLSWIGAALDRLSDWVYSDYLTSLRLARDRNRFSATSGPQNCARWPLDGFSRLVDGSWRFELASGCPSQLSWIQLWMPATEQNQPK